MFLNEFSVWFVVRISFCWVKARVATFSYTNSSGPSNIPALFAASIRLQWTITALWGGDTFSCSSICGVVINFLSVTGLSYNIRRLETACSPAINHKTKTDPTFLLYHLELFRAVMIQSGPTQWPISIKKTWGSFVCYRLLTVLVCLGPPINCAITPTTYASYKDNWFTQSIRIDPLKVSSMKLILFIVYKQHRSPLRRLQCRLWLSAFQHRLVGREGGCISFHHDHSLTACFVYIKLNCNATLEKYNWPQSQIKWL